jgi:hypothetical protein
MYMKLKRKQIYLEPASERTLKKLAAETGLSEAEHIRRAVRAYVEQRHTDRGSGQSDPLLQLIGICDDADGPRDGALRHDRYLYGQMP